MAVLTAPFAASRPDDLALADDSGTLTWRELDERVNRLIHRFREVGIDSGDTIAVVAGNCNEWFEIAFACSNAGITFIPVNWHLVAAEIAYLLGDSGSKALICGHQFIGEGAKALTDERTSGVEIALVDRRAGDRPIRELRRVRAGRVTRRTRRPEFRRADVLHERHDRPSEGCARHAGEHAGRLRPGDLAADRRRRSPASSRATAAPCCAGPSTTRRSGPTRSCR